MVMIDNIASLSAIVPSTKIKANRTIMMINANHINSSYVFKVTASSLS